MICKSLEEISSVVLHLLEMTGEDAVVILQGDLAAGKTTLVKALVKELGVKETVTSPTFSLQHCYGETIYHYDIYNEGIENFMGLGLFEEFEKPGLHLVEWGDERLTTLLKQAGYKVVVVKIEKQENQRCYRIKHA